MGSTSSADDRSTRGLHHPLRWLEVIASNARRMVVFLVGVTMLGAGVVMLVLPGPGMLVILVGLAILAREFAWAERTLDRAKGKAKVLTDELDRSRMARGLLALSAISLVGGGLIALLLLDGRQGLGISAIVAGTFAMAVLVPAVRRWVVD